MKHLLRVLLAAGSMALGIAVSHAADYHLTGTVSFLSVGETVMVEDNHPYFVGRFSGSYLDPDEATPFHRAAVVCHGFNDIGIGAGGYCSVTTLAGDKALIKWDCVDAAPAGGGIAGGACNGNFVSGTGGLAGVTGGGKYEAVILAVNPDGSSPGLAIWNFDVKTP